MLARTDTPNAPWTVIEANDLRWARVRFLRTIVNAIEAELTRRQAQAAAKAHGSPPVVQDKKRLARRATLGARSAEIPDA
jgi:hypothetical protein